jgi:hypothetical protein
MRISSVFCHFSALVVACCVLNTSHAFCSSNNILRSPAVSSQFFKPTWGSSALAASSRDDDKEYYDALALNMARTDVRNFLTQRAIQSFIFLLLTFRDPHTVRWLEVCTCEL